MPFYRNRPPPPLPPPFPPHINIGMYSDVDSKLAFVHGVISILSDTPTDCLKKKILVNLFFRAKKKKKKKSANFDFHFRENPRFRDEFQALVDISLCDLDLD